MTENELKSIKAINLEIARIGKVRRLLNCSNGSEKAKNEYKALLRANEDDLIGKKVELERIINGVENAEIRLILKLKFIDLRSWNYIAKTLHYDRSTVYKKYKRFVRGTEQ
jgi:DNA invertase Pin-like site-specific DNA recombinase